jgi:DNA modification methylase
MVAFALRADGWYLRSDIIWAKPNPMPESVTDRPTKAHEYLFLLSKGPRYFYDADAIREAAEHPRGGCGMTAVAPHLRLVDQETG